MEKKEEDKKENSYLIIYIDDKPIHIYTSSLGISFPNSNMNFVISADMLEKALNFWMNSQNISQKFVWTPQLHIEVDRDGNIGEMQPLMKNRMKVKFCKGYKIPKMFDTFRESS